MFEIHNNKSKELLSSAQMFLSRKRKNERDTPEIRSIKGLIRRCEAKATCRYVGISDERAHFLNLPFYETGTVEKKPMGERRCADNNGDLAENKTASNLLCRRFS